MTGARDRAGRFVGAEQAYGDVGQLARNSAGIPGGLGYDVPAGTVVEVGVVWTDDDAGPWAAPIGLALALETTDADPPASGGTPCEPFDTDKEAS